MDDQRLNRASTFKGGQEVEKQLGASQNIGIVGIGGEGQLLIGRGTDERFLVESEV